MNRWQTSRIDASGLLCQGEGIAARPDVLRESAGTWYSRVRIASERFTGLFCSLTVCYNHKWPE
ncbi:hypothetical protein [Paenibacillus jiagnxiensis]|uniref:hypothetical protein n=1 Tax=Paenibacillus jiagnxiensis TaxID=3228926 RepID=UPI0033AAF14A